MSVAAVARKDFRDGIRSKLLWTLMALFVLLLAGLTYFMTRNASGEEGAVVLLATMGLSSIVAVIFLVPLTGLVVSLKSIVRERELGSIKILLSLPHERSEVIAGKFLGRVGLLTTAILAGYVPAAVIIAVRLGDFPVYEYVAFVLVTILFGVVFVAVGLSISAMTSSETQATVGGVAAFFGLYFWNNIFGFLNAQLDLLSPSGDAYMFIERFNLITVFVDSLIALLSVRHEQLPNVSTVHGPAFQAAMEDSPETLDLAAQPFYLQHWFAFVILGLWIAVPVVIGYLRFSRTDL